MGFKFNKRIKICKGVHLNVGKKGISTSVKIGRTTINSKGRVTHNLGHGISYTHNLAKTGAKKSTRKENNSYVVENEIYVHEDEYGIAEILNTKIVGVTFECRNEPNIKRQDVLLSIRKNSKVALEPFVFEEKIGYMVVREKDGLDVGVLPADIADYIYTTYGWDCRFEVTIIETYKMEETRSLNVSIEILENLTRKSREEAIAAEERNKALKKEIGEKLKATTYHNEHLICILGTAFIASLGGPFVLPLSIGVWIWSKKRVDKLLLDDQAGNLFLGGFMGWLLTFFMLLVPTLFMAAVGQILAVIGGVITYFILRNKYYF